MHAGEKKKLHLPGGVWGIESSERGCVGARIFVNTVLTDGGLHVEGMQGNRTAGQGGAMNSAPPARRESLRENPSEMDPL